MSYMTICIEFLLGEKIVANNPFVLGREVIKWINYDVKEEI